MRREGRYRDGGEAGYIDSEEWILDGMGWGGVGWSGMGWDGMGYWGTKWRRGVMWDGWMDGWMGEHREDTIPYARWALSFLVLIRTYCRGTAR